MARPMRFPDTAEGRADFMPYYQQYMEPGVTIFEVVNGHGFNEQTFCQAMRRFHLPTKVVRNNDMHLAMDDQAENHYPLDLMAAKYKVKETTIRQWAMKQNRTLVGTRPAAAKLWWKTYFARFECLEDMLLSVYRELRVPQAAMPAIYHKWMDPVDPIFWALESPRAPVVNVDIDADTVSALAETTEADDEPHPTLFLGIGKRCNPIRFIEDDEPIVPEREAYNDAHHSLMNPPSWKPPA